MGDSRTSPPKQDVNTANTLLQTSLDRTLCRSQTSPYLGADFWADVENDGLNMICSISPLRTSERPRSDECPSTSKRRRQRKSLKKRGRLKMMNKLISSGDTEPDRGIEDAVIKGADNTSRSSISPLRTSERPRSGECPSISKRRRRRKSSKKRRRLKMMDKLISSGDTELYRGIEDAVVRGTDNTSRSNTVTQKSQRTKRTKTNKPQRKLNDDAFVIHQKDLPEVGVRESYIARVNANTTIVEPGTEMPKISIAERVDPHKASVDPHNMHSSVRLKRAAERIDWFEAKRQKSILDRRKSCQSLGDNFHQEAQVRNQECCAGQEATSVVSIPTAVDPQGTFSKSLETSKSMRYQQAIARIADFEEKRRKHIHDRRASCPNCEGQNINGKEVQDQEESHWRISPCRHATQSTSAQDQQHSALRGVYPQNSHPDPHDTPKSTTLRLSNVKARMAHFEEKRQRHIQNRRISSESSQDKNVNPREAPEQENCHSDISPSQQITQSTATLDNRYSTPGGADPEKVGPHPNESPKTTRCQRMKARIAKFEEKRQQHIHLKRKHLENTQRQAISCELSPQATLKSDQHAQSLTAIFNRTQTACRSGENQGPDYITYEPCKQDTPNNIAEAPINNHDRSDFETLAHPTTPPVSMCCSSSSCTCKCPSLRETPSSISKGVQVSPYELGLGTLKQPVTEQRQAPSNKSPLSTSKNQISQTEWHIPSERVDERLTLNNQFHQLYESYLQSSPVCKDSRRIHLEDAGLTVQGDLFKAPLTDITQRGKITKHTPLLRRMHQKRRGNTQEAPLESREATDTNSACSRSSKQAPTPQKSPTPSPAMKTLPAPFSFMRFTRGRYSGKTRQAKEQEPLFSSDDETDPDVVSARVASQTFLRTMDDGDAGGGDSSSTDVSDGSDDGEFADGGGGNASACGDARNEGDNGDHDGGDVSRDSDGGDGGGNISGDGGDICGDGGDVSTDGDGGKRFGSGGDSADSSTVAAPDENNGSIYERSTGGDGSGVGDSSIDSSKSGHVESDGSIVLGDSVNVSDKRNGVGFDGNASDVCGDGNGNTDGDSGGNGDGGNTDSSVHDNDGSVQLDDLAVNGDTDSDCGGHFDGEGDNIQKSTKRKLFCSDDTDDTGDIVPEGSSNDDNNDDSHNCVACNKDGISEDDDDISVAGSVINNTITCDLLQEHSCPKPNKSRRKSHLTILESPSGYDKQPALSGKNSKSHKAKRTRTGCRESEIAKEMRALESAYEDQNMHSTDGLIRDKQLRRVAFKKIRKRERRREKRKPKEGLLRKEPKIPKKTEANSAVVSSVHDNNRSVQLDDLAVNGDTDSDCDGHFDEEGDNIQKSARRKLFCISSSDDTDDIGDIVPEGRSNDDKDNISEEDDNIFDAGNVINDTITRDQLKEHSRPKTSKLTRTKQLHSKMVESSSGYDEQPALSGKISKSHKAKRTRTGSRDSEVSKEMRALESAYEDQSMHSTDGLIGEKQLRRVAFTKIRKRERWKEKRKPKEGLLRKEPKIPKKTQAKSAEDNNAWDKSDNGDRDSSADDSNTAHDENDGSIVVDGDNCTVGDDGTRNDILDGGDSHNFCGDIDGDTDGDSGGDGDGDVDGDGGNVDSSVSGNNGIVQLDDLAVYDDNGNSGGDCMASNKDDIIEEEDDICDAGNVINDTITHEPLQEHSGLKTSKSRKRKRPHLKILESSSGHDKQPKISKSHKAKRTRTGSRDSEISKEIKALESAYKDQNMLSTHGLIREKQLRRVAFKKLRKRERRREKRKPKEGLLRKEPKIPKKTQAKSAEDNSTSDKTETAKTSSKKQVLRGKKHKTTKSEKKNKLGTPTQVMSQVEMQQRLAKRTDANRAICQSMIPPFPVEWQEPVMSTWLQAQHQQFLQDTFFKLLVKQARKFRRSERTVRRGPPTCKEIRALSYKERQRIRKLTIQVESEGWTDYEILPQIYTEPDTKSFIRKVK